MLCRTYNIITYNAPNLFVKKRFVHSVYMWVSAARSSESNSSNVCGGEWAVSAPLRVQIESNQIPLEMQKAPLESGLWGATVETWQCNMVDSEEDSVHLWT